VKASEIDRSFSFSRISQRLNTKGRTSWNRDPLLEHVIAMVEKHKVRVQVLIAALEAEDRLDFNGMPLGPNIARQSG
jgi:hypothetical protein